jgi:hypothetical protein
MFYYLNEIAIENNFDSLNTPINIIGLIHSNNITNEINLSVIL